MIKETSMDYQRYRQEVLAKTSGANIHKVNGLLGNILNATSNEKYWRSKGSLVLAEEALRQVIEAKQKIAKLVKVSKK